VCISWILKCWTSNTVFRQRGLTEKRVDLFKHVSERSGSFEVTPKHSHEETMEAKYVLKWEQTLFKSWIHAATSQILSQLNKRSPPLLHHRHMFIQPQCYKRTVPLCTEGRNRIFRKIFEIRDLITLISIVSVNVFNTVLR